LITREFAKASIGKDDRVLGFTVFGVEASEMLAVVQTAMLGGLACTSGGYARPAAAGSPNRVSRIRKDSTRR
jgi:hypothetical protein